MSKIKPLILEWCVQVWKGLKENTEAIKGGWNRCCLQYCDALDSQVRREVANAAHRGEFDGHLIPEGEEEEGDDDEGLNGESDHEEDEEKDVLDVDKEIRFGNRRGNRKRAQQQLYGYMLNSSQIAMSGDSEA
jgi:hypothetical protein